MSDHDTEQSGTPPGNLSAGQTVEMAEAPTPDEQAMADDGANGEGSARLAELERERDEYLDQWRRAAAEFQNYRKREERLRAERERNVNARQFRKLLPVLDDLQRATQHVPAELSEQEWTKGMLAIERKLWSLLEQEGVTTIDVQPGTPFDPNVHEALITTESDQVEPGQIVAELERGYRFQDTVLRPARVSVAK